MLTLKKVKELVEAPSHAKRTPSPKMLFEEGIVLLRREFDQGSHLTVYNSGYVLFSAGKRNTVFHIHDCCGDYAYDAAEGKGDVIKEEYFENCEWHSIGCCICTASSTEPTASGCCIRNTMAKAIRPA